MILYIIVYNVIIIPVLVYLHVKGECTLLQPYLSNTTIPICSYINNFFINLLYAQVLFIVIGVLVYAKVWAGSPKKYRDFYPSSKPPYPKKKY